MLSVARYSFWSPPKIFSAPPDTKASSFQIKLNITKVKARKRRSELLMALQNFNFSHSKVKLYLKDKTCLQENLVKVHLLDSENSNAEAMEESSIHIIRHYVCVFNFNHSLIQLIVPEHLLCAKHCSAGVLFTSKQRRYKSLAFPELTVWKPCENWLGETINKPTK